MTESAADSKEVVGEKKPSPSLADHILRQQLAQQQHQGGGGGGGPRSRIQCPVCHNLVVRRVFRRHFETLHCVQAPVPCRFCSKVFKHRYSLDCHLRQAHPLQRFQAKRADLKAADGNNSNSVNNNEGDKDVQATV